MNKKKREQRKLIIGGVVVLFLLGAVAVLASQLGVFKGDQRSKADGPCSMPANSPTEYYCANGLSYQHTCSGIQCAGDTTKVCGTWGTETLGGNACGGTGGGGGTTGGGGTPTPGGTGGGGGNGNTCETGGVTASACYGVGVNGRCINFNGQCQKTGTNSAGYATCGCRADSSATPPATRTPTPTTGCMNASTKCENNVSYVCQNNGWVRDGKGCSGSTTPPKPTSTPPKPTVGTGGAGSPCTSDSNCQSGSYCSLANYRCKDLGGFNAPCTRNTQCQSGMYCSGIAGCQNKGGSGTFCYYGNQCKSGFCYYLKCS